VPKRQLILDPSKYDLNHVIADIDEIRRYNRQRFEMEQLTAIVYEDRESAVCVGYKDLGPTEFWIRGHMPGIPLMPGVIMCEAAAQLASYFTQKYKLMDTPVVGFGGLKDVRFRGVVQPGERFVVACRLLKVRSMILTSEFQCLVRDNMVCEGVLMGIPLPEELFKGLGPTNP
jgi:3-hydroxyacyl-[acyl-carrier-protein] dehydratase